MSSFPRDEVLSAFEVFLDMQERDDWEATIGTFTEDGVYNECHAGRMVGHDEIRAWLLPAMEPCKGWTYPERWRAIDGDHIAYGWLNRLPGQRPDGSYYEFMGTSVKVYAGDGLFSYHEDVYNMQTCIEVITEWRKANGA